MGAVFGMFAAYYFWSPKIIGKSYNELLAHIHFWTMFIGVVFYIMLLFKVFYPYISTWLEYLLISLQVRTWNYTVRDSVNEDAIAIAIGITVISSSIWLYGVL